MGSRILASSVGLPTLAFRNQPLHLLKQKKHAWNEHEGPNLPVKDHVYPWNEREIAPPIFWIWFGCENGLKNITSAICDKNVVREMSVKWAWRAGQIYPLKTMFTREMTVKCPPTFFGSDLDLKSQKLACVLGLTVRKPAKTRVGARFGTLSIKPRVNLTSKFGKFAFVIIFSAFASEHLRFQNWP